jgi:hypothetical protein
MSEIVAQKRCSKCKKYKFLNEFAKDKRASDGRKSYCLSCKRKQDKSYREAHPDRVRKWISANKTRWNELKRKYRKAHPQQSNNLSKYGLSKHDYKEMLVRQGGKCAICGCVPNGKRLSVDHDHKTGKVRKLLCNSCNLALGLLKDDVSLFEKAIEYLKVVL